MNTQTKKLINDWPSDKEWIETMIGAMQEDFRGTPWIWQQPARGNCQLVGAGDGFSLAIMRDSSELLAVYYIDETKREVHRMFPLDDGDQFNWIKL